MEQKTTQIKFSEIIKERGLKRSWIADKIGVCPGHLTNMLCGKSTLTKKHTKAINQLLKTKF